MYYVGSSPGRGYSRKFFEQLKEYLAMLRFMFALQRISLEPEIQNPVCI